VRPTRQADEEGEQHERGDPATPHVHENRAAAGKMPFNPARRHIAA